MPKITSPPRLLRGLFQNLPSLPEAVMAFTTDDKSLWIGTADGQNVRFPNSTDSSNQRIGGIYAYGYLLKGPDAEGMILCDGKQIDLTLPQYSELQSAMGGAAQYTLPNLVGVNNCYPYLRFKRP